ncbi:MAG TPA: hypothetical protein EYQ09_07390 [Flavobacteriales bacterium]|nr:hypothetical protein [Flavobacteriales bacterium]
MKKLLLLLITITTFTNVSYASFPVMESIQSEKSTIIDCEDPKLFGIEFGTARTPPLLLFILPWLIPLLLFLLIRGYRRDVAWIKNLIRWKNIWWFLLGILIVIPVLFLVLFNASGMGG